MTRLRILATVVGASLTLGSCGQLQITTDKISELCAKALPLATLAAPLPVVGPYIAAGVQIGCQTNEGLSRLRADANSALWLSEQIGLLRAALGR